MLQELQRHEYETDDIFIFQSPQISVLNRDFIIIILKILCDPCIFQIENIISAFWYQ